ncbi:class B sortase [Paratractidigestivibacter sp.]|uniref:class B sortase n=1 Tax=Paratractidigestivibacter sp. TaxID=2847316 RepID=UPI002ABD816C|nr:class B sortase [Paratractidigestivibacter sp.]
MASHFASDPQWNDGKQGGAESASKADPVAEPTTDATYVKGAAGNDAFERLGDDASDTVPSLTDPAPCATPEPPAKKKRIWPLVVLLVVLLGIATAGITFLVHYSAKENEAVAVSTTEEKPVTPQEISVDDSAQVVENPVDFATLKSENSDIFAWLYMPGCDINTPIFQSLTDDLFYLWRNKDKEEDLIGVPFIQLCNSTDLNDPVTVVYGHRNKGIFEALLQYQDSDFFDANLEFYVYTPGHIYTYTVVSAYIYDTRHIMNSFDFSKQSVVDEYFSFVQDPDSIARNVNANVSLSSDSKLLQLSTCSTTHTESDGRFIVSAVRSSDQPTN